MCRADHFLSVVLEAVVDTAVVRVQECVLFCVLLLWMTQLVIAVYQCQLVDCLFCGRTFLFYWALSFFPLRSVSCVGLLSVDSGINTRCPNDWTYTGSHTNTAHLASGKKWVLPYHYIPLPLRFTYLYSSLISAHFSSGVQPNSQVWFVYRYQRTGSKAAEEPLQSDLHPHREDHGA